MYKKTLINLTAITVAMSLAFSPAVTVFANEGDTSAATDTTNVATDIDIQVTDSGNNDNSNDASTPANDTHATDSDSNVQTDVASTTDSDSDVQSDVADQKDDAKIVNGSEIGEYFRETSGKTVVIEGDVTSESKENSTVYTEHNSDVTVNGNVTSENFRGVNAQSGSTITVNGDIDSEYKGAVSSNGNLAINGDVTADYVGVDTNNHATVTVNGDISATGYNLYSDEIRGKYDRSENSDIKNHVNEGIGITSDGTDTIFVDGNVTGLTDGILINPEVTTTKAGSIVVTGTIGSVKPINSARYNGTDYSKDAYADQEKNNNFASAGDDAATIAAKIVEAMPDITAYGFEENALSLAYSLKGSNVSYQDVHDEVNKTIDSKTHYIIKLDEASKNNFSIQDGLDPENQYHLMTMTATQALKVAVAEGYELSGGDNVTITANEDGTYSITLSNFKGYITLSAKLKTVNVPVNNVPANIVAAPNVVENVEAGVVENVESGSVAQYVQTSEPVEVSVPFIFATFTVSNSGSNDLPTVLGASLEDGTSELPVSARPKQVLKVADGELTAIQYKRAFIDSVKKAPLNGVVRLETAAPSCFDRMMLQALAARPDLTLEVAFPVSGQDVEVTIPAGYNVLSLLDSNGYCGFLYLNSIFNG